MTNEGFCVIIIIVNEREVTAMKTIITKEQMIITMIDNNYPEAIECLRDRKKHKFTREERIHYLQYHVLKDEIMKMFKAYLYWKIEG